MSPPWPESIANARRSVARFNKSIKRLTDGSVTLQAELRDMIQSASAKGELWTRDWDTVPLPSSLTADGGAAARQAAQAAAAAISAKVPCALTLLISLTQGHTQPLAGLALL